VGCRIHCPRLDRREDLLWALHSEDGNVRCAQFTYRLLAINGANDASATADSNNYPCCWGSERMLLFLGALARTNAVAFWRTTSGVHRSVRDCIEKLESVRPNHQLDGSSAIGCSADDGAASCSDKRTPWTASPSPSSQTKRRQGGYGSLSGIDRVIHEPARLSILAVLRAFESADCVFLLKQTELSRGNLSSHLSKLESAGYVKIRKEFVAKVPRTLVQLTDTGRKVLATYRGEMDRVLASL